MTSTTNDIAERIAARLDGAGMLMSHLSDPTKKREQAAAIVRTELEGEAVGLQSVAARLEEMRACEGGMCTHCIDLLIEAQGQLARISSPVAQDGEDGEVAAIRERQSDGYDEASGGDPDVRCLLGKLEVK